MDALKRTLGFTESESPERKIPSYGTSPTSSYEVSGGPLDSISASMVVIDGPPSLDQRGVGGCIEASDINGYGSTGSPSNNSNSSVEGNISSAPQMKERLVSMWNNMKFSKTVWALDSKKATAFSSSSGSNFSQTSPVWMLGKCYDINNSFSLSRQCSNDSNFDKQNDIHGRVDSDRLECTATSIDSLTADFHSRVWMTYRKDFEMFKGTRVDTDCGWGCMIRAGQMIVSNALISLHLGRHWRWKCDEKRSVFTGDDIQNEVTHRAIIRLFADACFAPFSIQNIIQIGQDTIKCKPGDWFGPGSTAHLFKQAIHSAHLKLQNSNHSEIQVPDWCYVNLISSFKIYVATDGTVYKQDVRDMCNKINNSNVINIDDKANGEKLSTEKEGGFSFLDEPDSSAFNPGESSYQSTEKEKRNNTNVDSVTSGGFAYIEDDMKNSTSSPGQVAMQHNESFDSVTEAVLLDDGIIRQYSLSQQVSVDGETWVTEEYSANISNVPSTHLSSVKSDKKQSSLEEHACHDLQKSTLTWTPVLMLIPVRLGGGEKLNPIYSSCVKNLLANENCVGIIGGRPQHALYFVGYQDDNLIHLDPHLVQDNVQMIDNQSSANPQTLPLDFDLSSYHCKSVRKMQLSRMDPSCCLGFLCKTSSDFENWCEIARDLATPSGATDYPIFSIMDGRVADHLGESEKLFEDCAMDIDKSYHAKATSVTGGTNSDSDADDFVFL